MNDIDVIHVTAHYPPFLGGLEKVVQALATARHRRGRPVRVTTGADGASSPAEEAGYVRRLRSVEVANTAIAPALLPVLIRAITPRSVLHIHVAQAYVPEVAALAARLRRAPYVAHLHIDVGPSGRAGFLLRLYKPLVLGRVLRRAQAVVVFTPEQAAMVALRYRVAPDRIAVVPNGVDAAFFDDRPRQVPERPRLLFVGRLAVQKNLPLLLRALEGISGRFETTLVGDGDLEARLKSLTRELGLQNVHFHGRADGDELRRLYREADVFVLPSDREGMPLVLLEALAMGLPIVATDVPGNRDVVTDRQTGRLVPADDVPALRKALLDIVSDPEEYQRMSRAARRAADGFAWPVVSERFEQIYRQAR